MRLWLVTAFVLACAGCLTTPEQPTQTRTGDGAGEPETFFLTPRGMSHKPNEEPMEAWGVANGGPRCLDGLVDFPCWSHQYRGAPDQDHSTEDVVAVDYWFQGKGMGELTLEVWLMNTSGSLLAQGQSSQFTPASGTAAPGPDGCVPVHVEMVLSESIDDDSILLLDVRVRDLIGSDCPGGGMDGNRMTIGTQRSS